MTDRTLLTEALDKHKKALPALALHLPAAVFEDYKAVAVTLDEAARWARDFPTDEQVEAAMEMIPGIPRGEIVDALEAVRDTMIGDNQLCDAEVGDGWGCVLPVGHPNGHKS